MEGRVLLVAGGYSGVARGDLVAYKVPLFVSSDPGDRVIHLDDTFLFSFLFSFFFCKYLYFWKYAYAHQCCIYLIKNTNINIVNIIKI